MLTYLTYLPYLLTYLTLPYLPYLWDEGQERQQAKSQRANKTIGLRKRTKGQESRNKAREAWGKLQSLKPRLTTLTFLQHREVASPRDFGEMFPVICESFWLSFGILRRLIVTLFFTYVVVRAIYAYFTYLHMGHYICLL